MTADAYPPLPTDAAGLIPHGPMMRMVDRLLEVEDKRSQCDFTIPDNSVWLDSAGRLDESAYIEMIAQAFAATHGYHLSAADREKHRGLLIGVKNLVVHGSAHRGDHLTITVYKVVGFGDFGVVDGEIHSASGTLLAAGQIKVWRPGEDPAKEVML